METLYSRWSFSCFCNLCCVVCLLLAGWPCTATVLHPEPSLPASTRAAGAEAPAPVPQPPVRNEACSETLPVALKLIPGVASPVSARSISFTVEVVPQPSFAGKQGKITLSVTSNLTLDGQKEAVLGEVTARSRPSFSGRIRFTGAGKGVLTATFAYVNAAGSREAVSRSIYLLLESGQTFYSPFSFEHAQEDRLKHLKNAGGLTEDQYQQRLEEMSSETIPFDTTAPAAPEPETGTPEGDDVVSAARFTLSGTIRWTDPTGATHPVKLAKVEIWDADKFLNGSDNRLATVQTNEDGFYAARLGTQRFDNPDLYIKVFAANEFFFVLPEGRDRRERFTYNVRSGTRDDVSRDTRIDLTIGATDAQGQPLARFNAFSIHAAIVEGALYVKNLNGATPARFAIEYPNSADFSLAGSAMSITVGDRFDWDILHHEYGHFVAAAFDLARNPGGEHNFGDNQAERYGKDVGFRLAWGEGWPSYFAVSLQRERGLDIPAVGAGNVQFENTENGAYAYDLEINGRAYYGEDHEVVIQRILWDLYDSQDDDADHLSLGDQVLWQVIKDSRPRVLFDLWQALTKDKPLAEINAFSLLFADFQVAPSLVGPAAGTEVGVFEDLTFEWTRGGAGPKYRNNHFIVEFYDNSLTTLLHSTGPLTGPFDNNPFLVLSWDRLAAIFEAESEVKWLVKASNTDAPATGPYVSPAFSLTSRRTVRLNAGGNPYTAEDNRAFRGDAYVRHGYLYHTNAQIENTGDDYLYQTQRYSNCQYDLPLFNGTYQVTLHFAETYFNRAGARLFHVTMEGQRKLTDYDIFAAAGGSFRAVRETFTVEVKDRNLHVSFGIGAANYPTIAAIEVMPVPKTLAAQARRVENRDLAPEDAPAVRLHPNPVQDRLTIRLPLPAGQVLGTSITDASGKVYLHNAHRATGERELQLSVGSLPKGLYLLGLRTQAGYRSVKFLKQ
jgi:hypothetical protein